MTSLITKTSKDVNDDTKDTITVNDHKRKHSEEQEETTNSDSEPLSKKQQTSITTNVVNQLCSSPTDAAAAAATPAPLPFVALPSSVLHYANGQYVPIIPQQSICHMYHHPQTSMYYPISSHHQQPFTNNYLQYSPTLPSQQSPNDNDNKTTTPRLLPKPTTNSTEATFIYSQPPTPLSPFDHPHVFLTHPISPTLLPSSSYNATRPTPKETQSTADQREKARRISHSAIERRRRERINDKILQLKQLIPTCRDQENLHKMSILQSAIDYIAYLQDVVQNHPRLSNDLLQGAHLTPKKTKSLLPKEVEPFTSQFSVQKGLKPIDLILSSATTTPLTPPHQEDETKHMSLQNILC